MPASSGGSVCVVGVGMMTAVGLTAPETAASVRAATMRFTSIHWLDRRYEHYQVAEVPDDGLPELEASLAGEPSLSDREARMLRLGTMPLLECLAAVPDARGAVGLILALPDTETARPLDRERFLDRFARQTGGAFDRKASRAGLAGRAGGLEAVAEAREAIAEGKADLLVAGGIDTYLALHLLDGLDAEGRVKSGGNLDGFIPGEGAAFLLLAGRAKAAALGLTPLVEIPAVSRGFEKGHLYSAEPYRGDGLAATFADLFRGWAGAQPIRDVFSSMNGENHWAKEWGVGYLRNRKAFDPAHGMHHPADCFGDAGAASGPLLAGLAAVGISRGYRNSPCLVYCSSDRGRRIAVGLSGA